jgi:RNA polymerase sigma-70 factor (ECF subfamily)
MIDDSPQTRHSLVIRLRDKGDQEAWTWFIETYGPLVHGFLRRQGLQEADARDVAQEVFMSVAADIHGQASRRPGAFRKWLYTIVRNRISDYWRRHQRHPQGTGDTHAQKMLAEVAADAKQVEEEWDRAYLRHLFVKAANCVKGDFEAKTWQAFWRTSVDEESAQSVAPELQLSVAAVYMAKRRVLKRIQQHIGFLEGVTK